MKSKVLNSSKLSWNDSLLKLTKSKKTVDGLLGYGIKTLENLAWIFPLRLKEIKTDLEAMPVEGELIAVRGNFDQVQARPNFGRRTRPLLYQVKASFRTDIGEFSIQYFNSYPSTKDKIQKLISEQKSSILIGQVSYFHHRMMMVNPKIIDGNNSLKSDLEIIYPTINKIPGKTIKGLIDKISLELWDQLSIGRAMKIHHGLISASEDEKKQAADSLIYHELLQDQYKIYHRKMVRENIKSIPLYVNKAILEKTMSSFPYSLTPGQKNSVDEIISDFQKSYPMSRLLQGEVGSGKTTVAAIAAAITANANFQVALMCPTETLARQHFANFSKLLGNLNVDLLISSMKAKEKKELLQKIQEGKSHIVIGTHALFQDKVIFKNLNLVIIDEQHKFGVNQRVSLTEKGASPHTLLMTATPIPRTLRLTHFGDLDVSTLTDLPNGKKNIKSRMVEKNNYEKFLSFLKTRLTLGELAYVVTPAIDDESEMGELQNTENLKKELAPLFPEFKISTLHGRMTPEEKDTIITQFKNHEIQMLISTTVIEVGIDIHDATVMAIYNPERFGLSSLHQLRGRVGRGSKPGFFFMVESEKWNQSQIQKLKIIEGNNNGFEIAEEDLRLRGEGNLFGKEQSGYGSYYKIASLPRDQKILEDVIADFSQLDFSKDKALFADKKDLFFPTI